MSSPVLTDARRVHLSGRNTRVGIVAVALCLLALLGAALGHVYVRLEQVHTGYALSQARREALVLSETQKRLRLELEVLKQPKRIEQIARTRLGMLPPDPNAIHVVRVAKGEKRHRATNPSELARAQVRREAP